MKEIYFKAETELELFFMMDSYVKGYVENNGLYKELKERYLKEQFLKFNPIGKLVKSKTQKNKNYKIENSYPILDVKIHYFTVSKHNVSLLLKGDDGKNSWKPSSDFSNLIYYN